MDLYEDPSAPCRLGETRLCTGDIVSLNTRHIEEEVVAAFVGYLPDKDQYLFLLPNAISGKYRHDGTFDKRDMFTLGIRSVAVQAIPLESGERCFSQNQRVRIDEESGQEGQVIAAIRGTIALKLDNGEIALGLRAEKLRILQSLPM